jgi:hypothetical protein
LNKFIIINNEESDFKNILISDESIKALENNFETQEKFNESFASEGNGILGIKDDIQFKQIESLATYNDDFGIQLKYKKQNGKTETTFYEFDTAEQKEEVKLLIVENTHLKQIDSESAASNNLSNRWLIYLVTSISMIGLYLTMELPKSSLFIMIPFFIGLGYWVKLGQTKKEILDESYIK